MEKEKTIDTKIIGFTVVAAVLGASFAAAMSMSAYGGDVADRNNFEYRDEIRSAIENGDYDAWADLTNDRHGRMMNVAEDTFNEVVDRYETLEEALDSNDYDAWVELMDGRGRISDVINEDNFDKFVDMHEAMEDGDYEAAQEIREELGLGMHPQDGTGFHNGGKGNGRHSGGMMNGGGARRGFNS